MNKNLLLIGFLVHWTYGKYEYTEVVTDPYTGKQTTTTSLIVKERIFVHGKDAANFIRNSPKSCKNWKIEKIELMKSWTSL